MNKKILGFAIVASLSLTALSVSAEDMYRGAWYAVPGVSYMNTDSDLDADHDLGGFIAIGKELNQSWDLQARLGYNNNSEDFTSSTRGDYKSTQLGLDALYMFSRDQFRPFILAGLGVTRNNLDYTVSGVNLDGKKTSWLASVGLGAQYLITDRFGVQVDLRQQFSRGRVTSGINATESGSISNTLLNIGGIFRFGAPAPVIVAATPEPAPMPIVPEPTPVPVVTPVATPVAPEPAAVCEEKLDTLTINAAELFGFDQSSIKSEGKAELNAAAEKIKANPGITNVLVTGHTDYLGSFEYNQKLSESRAAQVVQYLVEQGVNPDLITATGRGEASPIVKCNGVKPRAALIECLQPNRRVTVEANIKESECK